MENGAERRKTLRFTSKAFSSADVCLAPRPPIFGEFGPAQIVDLSAGGMKLQMKELVPRNVFLKLHFTLPDQTPFDSVVKVKHAVRDGLLFFHGLEFLNPAPDMVAKINAMAVDYLSCEDRISQGVNPVCALECSFFKNCRKSQKGMIAPDVFSPSENILQLPPQQKTIEDLHLSPETSALFRQFHQKYDEEAA